jgi:hypothetical protein
MDLEKLTVKEDVYRDNSNFIFLGLLFCNAGNTVGDNSDASHIPSPVRPRQQRYR